MWKTDYQGIHESKYKRFRETGKAGWSNDEDRAVALGRVGNALTTLGLKPGSTLLFLGCGVGRLVHHFAAEGYVTHGLDIAPTALIMAEETRPPESSASFVLGSVLKVPYQDGQFDLVVDDHCYHCIIGEDRALFLSEAFRVLRPGGWFIPMTMLGPLPDDFPELVRKSYDPETRCQITDEGIAARYFALESEILGELEAAGFHVGWHKVVEEDHGIGFLIAHAQHPEA